MPALTWVAPTFPWTYEVDAVAWSAPLGLFAAVGLENTENGTPYARAVATSPDGVTWTAHGNPWQDISGFAKGLCIIWVESAGLFVAGGDGGGSGLVHIVTSSDGITWMPQTTPWDGMSAAVETIEWSESQGLFIAGGSAADSSVIMTSPDAVTWMGQVTPLDGGVVTGVGYSPDLDSWAASGASGINECVMTSPDGVTWTTQTTPFDGPGVYGASMGWSVIEAAFLLGGVSADNTMTLCSSSDGIVWTQVPNGFDPNGIVEWTFDASGRIIVLGDDDGFTYVVEESSDDGATWTIDSTAMDNGTGYGGCYSPELDMVVIGGFRGSSPRRNLLTAMIGPLVPAAPTLDSVLPGVSSADLSWTPVSGPGYPPTSSITGYNVYRGTTSGGETLLVGLGVTTTYTDSTVSTGTEYYYKVTAVNANGESDFSNEIAVVPGAPSAPTLVSVTAVGTSCDLVWTTPDADGGSAITGYKVYRGTTSGGETLHVSLGVTTTYTDTIVAGTTYYYKITAFNAVAEGPFSGEVSTTLLYAARAGNLTTSDLYVLDPATGILTSIGPLGFAVTGMAWDPTTLTMYGVTSGNSGANPRSLITIDLITGVGTLVGAFGFPLGDISCDGGGNLFGWRVSGTPHGLYSINKSTGVATNVAVNNGPGTLGGALTFDGAGNLWLSADGDEGEGGSLYSIDSVTGLTISSVLFTGYGDPTGDGVLNAATIGPTGVLYANGQAFVGSQPYPNYLLTITYPGGFCVHLSDPSLGGVDAIAYNIGPPLLPPGAPTLDSATPGLSSADLSWTPGLGGSITGYNVYRGTTSGGETLLISLGVTTTYTDSTLSTGTTYYYKITAVNPAGESDLSNELFVTPGAPTAPTLVSAFDTGTGVNLVWTAPSSDGGSAIVGYRIYRGTASGSEVLIASTGNVLAYSDTTAAAGSTYYYKIKAANIISDGAFSNELFVGSGWIIAGWATSVELSQGVRDFAYSPSLELIVAVGQPEVSEGDRHIATSVDAKVWNVLFGSGRTAPMYCVCWSADLNLFVAGGSSDLSDNRSLMSSPDGVTWTVRGPTGWTIRDVIWVSDLGKFVAVGTDGGIPGAHISLTSPDGINWTPGTTLPSVLFQTTEGFSVCWSSVLQRFVLIGRFTDFAICTSADGVTWQPQMTGNIGNGGIFEIAGVAWFDSLNLFVATLQTFPDAVFPAPGIATSPDGINWTARATSPFTESVSQNSVLATAVGMSAQGLVMAGGYGYPYSMASTLDGVRWSGQPSKFDPLANSFNVISSICGIPELGITVVGLSDT